MAPVDASEVWSSQFKFHPGRSMSFDRKFDMFHVEQQLDVLHTVSSPARVSVLSNQTEMTTELRLMWMFEKWVWYKEKSLYSGIV